MLHRCFDQKNLHINAISFNAETEEEIFEEVLRGDLDFISDPWPNISEGAKDLVRRMLVRDPKKRLTAHEVLCKCLFFIFLFFVFFLCSIPNSNTLYICRLAFYLR